MNSNGRLAQRARGLRRRPRPSDGYDPEAFFLATVAMHGSRCWLERSGFTDCDGPLDAHHVYPKRKLPGERKNDPRNGLPVCRRHHDLLEGAHLKLSPDELPASVAEFRREFRLEPKEAA